jgi:hypothetical protein
MFIWRGLFDRQYRARKVLKYTDNEQGEYIASIDC